MVLNSVRRAFARMLAGALLALAAWALPAAAQTYPDRPVRIVVPFAPGGTNDVLARIIAQHLSDRLGQQFFIENKAGAGGNVGADLVAKSAPDGYTLLFAAPGPLAINVSLFKSLPYDPAKDFAPIGLGANVPIVLLVHPSVPARNVRELIDLARQQPGKMSFGSSGNGSTVHLAGELLKTMAKIDIVHVPYRGAGPAMNDLVAGHIPILFDNMPTALQQIAGGTVRALAVAEARRVPALPNVPTIAESGVPGFEATGWYGMVAPAQTPAPVLKQLADAMAEVLKNDAVKARFRELGAEPGTLFLEHYGRFLEAETAKWRDVIRASGAKAD